MSAPVAPSTMETPPAPATGAVPLEPAPTAPPAAEPQKPTETVEFWKQQARTNEQRAKDNAAAAQELQKIKDRDLTDLQLAQRERDEAKARAEKLERTSLQQQVALEKGIPADLVGSLSGNTAEELAAHADRLLAWRGTPTPPPVPQPQPDFSQGGRPLEGAAVTDAEFEAHRSLLFPNHRK